MTIMAVQISKTLAVIEKTRRSTMLATHRIQNTQKSKKQTKKQTNMHQYTRAVAHTQHWTIWHQKYPVTNQMWIKCRCVIIFKTRSQAIARIADCTASQQTIYSN